MPQRNILRSNEILSMKFLVDTKTSQFQPPRPFLISARNSPCIPPSAREEVLSGGAESRVTPEGRRLGNTQPLFFLLLRENPAHRPFIARASWIFTHVCIHILLAETEPLLHDACQDLRGPDLITRLQVAL